MNFGRKEEKRRSSRHKYSSGKLCLILVFFNALEHNSPVGFIFFMPLPKYGPMFPIQNIIHSSYYTTGSGNMFYSV